MEAIATFIGKAIWAIVGGTISIAFIGGILGAFGCMADMDTRSSQLNSYQDSRSLKS